MLLVNKIDVLSYFNFSLARCETYARRVNPNIRIIPICAATGEGMEAWTDWLRAETQAWREVRDLMRYRPPAPDADYEKRLSEAKGKLVRAAVINHVLLPAALHAVTSMYRLALGYDPEWEKEGWHWTLLRDIVAGQFSRVFFLGAISTVTTDVLITGKPVRDVPALIPAEGVVKLLGNVGVTARDVATLNYERVQKDLDRLLKSTSITRTPYDIFRLATGKAYAEREERREKRRKAAARKK